MGSNLFHKGGNLHQAMQVIIHPDNNQPIYLDYNIALVKLYTAITFVKNVKAAAKLPKVGDVIKDNTQVFISGWGLKTATATGPSEKLRGVDIATTPQINCVWAYCNYYEITPRMVCATSPGIYSCRVSLYN